MINKVTNIAINLIIFLIPLLILPAQVYPTNYNLPKIVLLLVLGLFLLVILFIKRKELKFDLIDKTLLAFLFLILLSTIFSVNFSKAIIGEENRYEGLLAFIVYFSIYYCAKNFYTYNKNIKYYAIVTISICSVIGILQYYNVFPLTLLNSTDISGFTSSTFGNRNFFGSFLSMVVPLFIALYLVKGKKIYLLISYISFAALLLSMTRSAWLGFATASVIGLIYIIKNFNKLILKKVIYIIIGYLIIIYFLLFPPEFINNYLSNYSSINLLNKRIESIGTEVNIIVKADDTYTKNPSIINLGGGRFAIWKLTLMLVAKQPLLGSGPDTLIDGLLHNLKYETYNFILSTESYFDKAHNEYLQIAATLGIPALIVYLAFIAQIIAKSKKIFHNDILFILTVPIISYLVQAFFNISTIGVAPIFWFLLGIIQNEKFKQALE